MVYHILPEAEPFSAYYGGAISRWTANVLREDEDAMIIAPGYDDTWCFQSDRLKALPGLLAYHRLRRGSRERLPWSWRKLLAATIFGRVLTSLGSDDVVYVHNRPEFAAGIQRAFPHRRFKLLLHMHNSHLLNATDEDACCTDLTLFCSDFLQSEARRKFPALTTAVIPNGADELHFYPEVQNPINTSSIILFAGRLVHDKGVHVLIAAMQILARRAVAARAVIVGCSQWGSERETKYTRKLKIDAPPNVLFSAYKTGSELAKEFRRADVFCCPSVFNEPFGMVNVEAMACAVPVVATNVGGIPEVFRNGGALLVPPNDPHKLADALCALAGDLSLRKQIGSEGLKSFRKNFRWDLVRSRYREVIASIA
jgi:spore coat protein SA